MSVGPFLKSLVPFSPRTEKAAKWKTSALLFNRKLFRVSDSKCQPLVYSQTNIDAGTIWWWGEVQHQLDTFNIGSLYVFTKR